MILSDKCTVESLSAFVSETAVNGLNFLIFSLFSHDSLETSFFPVLQLLECQRKQSGSDTYPSWYNFTFHCRHPVWNLKLALSQPPVHASIPGGSAHWWVRTHWGPTVCSAPSSIAVPNYLQSQGEREGRQKAMKLAETWWEKIWETINTADNTATHFYYTHLWKFSNCTSVRIKVSIRGSRGIVNKSKSNRHIRIIPPTLDAQ